MSSSKPVQASLKGARFLEAVTPIFRKRRSDSALRTPAARLASPVTLVSHSSDFLPMATEIVGLDSLQSISNALIAAETVTISESPSLAVTIPIADIADDTDMGIVVGNKHVLPDDPFGDCERTFSRYQKASENLKASLNSPQAHWKSFKIPEANIAGQDTISQLREEINKSLTGRIEQKKSWIEKVFTAVSPLAKSLLMIAKEGQAVYPQTI